jgi:hypothetical protein
VRSYARAIKHMGLQHRFVSTDQVENGELGRAGYRVPILPRTIALSGRAAEPIVDFVKEGGTVIADGDPGLFDEHGRRLTTPALAEISPRTAMPSALGKGQALYLSPPGPRDRNGGKGLSDIFAATGIEPLVSLTRSDGQPPDDVETYIFDHGGATIVALLRDLDPSSVVSEIPPGGREAIDLKLPHPYEVYDVRAHRPLGLTAQLTLEPGPAEPVVIALSGQKLPGLLISGPPIVYAGENTNFRIWKNGNFSAARDIIHIEIADPDGKVVPYYSGNQLALTGATSYSLPLSINDRTGLRTIRARDLLTGGTASAPLQVEP